MTPQELQFVQAKIGSSFLRAFYPADYRAARQTSDRLVKLEKEEYKRLKTTETLTSKINIKLARSINLMDREISQLLASLDDVQNTVVLIGEEISSTAVVEEAMDRATAGFNMFDRWKRFFRDMRNRIKSNLDRKIPIERSGPAGTAEPATKPAPKQLPAPESAKPPPSKPALEPAKPTIGEKITSSFSSAVQEVVRAAGGVANFLEKTRVVASILGGIAIVLAAVRALFDMGSDLVELATWYGANKEKIPHEVLRKAITDLAIKHAKVFAEIGIAFFFLRYAAKFCGDLIGKMAAKMVARGAITAGAAAAAQGGFNLVVDAITIALAVWSIIEVVYEIANSGITIEDFTKSEVSVDDVVSNIYGAFVAAFGEPPETVEPSSGEAAQSPIVMPPSPASPPLTLPKLPEESKSSSGLFMSSAAAGEVEAPLSTNTPESQEVAQVVPTPYNIEVPDIEPADESESYGEDPNVTRDRVMNNLGANDSDRDSSGNTSDLAGDGAQDETSSNRQNTSDASARPGSGATGDGVRVNFALAGKKRSGMPDSDIISLVQKAAEAVGMSSITITSGKGNYISDSGRQKGQKSTMHSTGKAVDVVGFESPEQKLEFARVARSLGAGGIGVYADESLHVDLGRKRHWNWGGRPFPLAEGGKVHAKEGGTLTLLAEAGEPEYVVPQSKVENFAHEMLAARPSSRNKTKKHTHLMIVPIYT